MAGLKNWFMFISFIVLLFLVVLSIIVQGLILCEINNKVNNQIKEQHHAAPKI